MSKEAYDKYMEMTKGLIPMTDEWHDTEEGETHLDRMDLLWSLMTEEEIRQARAATGKMQREEE